MSANARPLHPMIRRLGQEDVERLAGIEHDSYLFPWSAGIFSDCIRVDYACHGLQLGTELAGYSIQNWGAGESHLLNLCVHPHWQRRGYGTLLLDQCIERARRHGCSVLFLEVRPSNHGAGCLYARHGFRVIGRRPAYYQSSEGREDALVMEKTLEAD